MDVAMSDQLQRLKAALADRYAIEREIGSGGMAIVYLGRDIKYRGRQVAVKVFKPHLVSSVAYERFLLEISIVAKFQHPNIVPLFDSGVADNLLYYVMPWVEGDTLDDHLKQEGQLHLDDALQITRDIAAALQYAHAHGVVHRDIKPGNILLSSGMAMVADFGVARALGTSSDENLTDDGIAVGTPFYMSPEQALASEQASRLTDIYALGCVLYKMLTGRVPHEATSPQEVIARRIHQPAPRVREIRRRIPKKIDAAVAKALHPLPSERFHTAEAFSRAISPKRKKPGAFGTTPTLPLVGPK